jgi:Tetratricopeptide repeat
VASEVNLRAVNTIGKLIRDAVRALADRQRVRGADHLDTLISRSNLAAAYEPGGRLAEAIQLLGLALATGSES